MLHINPTSGSGTASWGANGRTHIFSTSIIQHTSAKQTFGWIYCSEKSVKITCESGITVRHLTLEVTVLKGNVFLRLNSSLQLYNFDSPVPVKKRKKRKVRVVGLGCSRRTVSNPVEAEWQTSIRGFEVLRYWMGFYRQQSASDRVGIHSNDSSTDSARIWGCFLLSVSFWERKGGNFVMSVIQWPICSNVGAGC